MERAAASCAAWLDRRRALVLALFTLLFLAQFAASARHKPLWHDEIYTVLLSRLPSVTAQWAALRDGVDLVPPLNGVATRAILPLAGHGPVAVRIPAAIGFWTMVLAVFALVRRRGSTALALTAALVPFFRPAYRYSYEARPYGLMMGLAALAWWSWAEAARGDRRRRSLTILTLALAAGVWNHYYAVLVYVPIAAGELTRAIRARRIDAPLWSAIGVSAIASLPLVPLIRAAAAQTGHFWAHPTPADVSATYDFLFHDLLDTPLPWTVAVAAAIGVASRVRSDTLVAARDPIPPHEVAAAGAAVLLPLCGVLLALALTGAFVPRYGLAAIGAVSVVLPLTISRLARGGPAIDLVLLVALAVPYARTLPAAIQAPPFENPVSARPLLEASLRQPGPTIASAQLWFLQLWYYAPPELKTKMIYVADPEHSLRYTGSDTMDRNYLALARCTAVPVERLDVLLQRHRDFRIYGSGSGWLLDWLRDARAQVDMIGTEAGGQLYNASVPTSR